MKVNKVKKHFVVFLSPGTFVSESSSVEVSSWNVNEAMELAHGIQERHGATPYGFYFLTRGRGEFDMDSKVIEQSKGIYYLGGTIFSRQDVIDRDDPNERILRSNMESNNIDRIIENTNSWKFTTAFKETDTLLDWSPRK